ncbi:hypothetical protein [Ancylothrix sp. D3o]|nr:hypothetical protein [Ancylothrix sp. D3o]
MFSVSPAIKDAYAIHRQEARCNKVGSSACGGGGQGAGEFVCV